jgi:outer membrane protein assembly factor BamD
MYLRIIFIISLLVLTLSCSNKDKILYESTNKENPYVIYSEALDAFNKSDFFFAQKQFSKAELKFSEINFAAKSSIMASFSLYNINFYEEALENLERYLKTYPADENLVYAHYLIAIIYFEQMSDEKKDIGPLLNAENKINFFLKKYPKSDYATDLKFKKDLIQNQLAAKELYIAKFYISVQKWVPAIRRLKNIVKNYEQTVFIEEALHRLVEINFHLGIEEEAKIYANILGYNYNSSKWFEQSYKILNKDYKIPKLKNFDKKDKSFIKKIIEKII